MPFGGEVYHRINAIYEVGVNMCIYEMNYEYTLSISRGIVPPSNITLPLMDRYIVFALHFHSFLRAHMMCYPRSMILFRLVGN